MFVVYFVAFKATVVIRLSNVSRSENAIFKLVLYFSARMIFLLRNSFKKDLLNHDTYGSVDDNPSPQAERKYESRINRLS